MSDFNQNLQDSCSFDQPCFNLSTDPFVQFEQWMKDAIDAKIYDPNACSLGTVDGEGRPSARAVLLKGLEDGRFVFYSNYNSRKASHLAVNANVSMHFPWFPFSVRSLLGDVSRVEDSLAEEYFHSVYLSQIGAWAAENQTSRFTRNLGEIIFGS